MSLSLSLRSLNTQPAAQTLKSLLACCPSKSWTDALLQHRPFGSLEQLLQAAAKEWRAMSAEQWRAATAGAAAAAATGASAALLAAFAAEEQRCVAQSPQAEQAALQASRDEYARKFGRAPVQATYGLSAASCLAALQQRLANAPEKELAVTVDEQNKITQRRISALLASQPVGSSALTAGSNTAAAPVAAAAPAPAAAAAAASAGLNIAVSTHVLNTSNGLPAANIRVAFEAQSESNRSAWECLGEARTNSDGRIGSFPPIRTLAPTANYRLVFDAEEYFAQLGVAPAFFPHITIQWQVSQQHDHARAKLHVPLLLSPFGYSTYRGS